MSHSKPPLVLYRLLQNLPSSIEPYVACPNEAPYHSRFTEVVGPDNMYVLPHRAFRLIPFWALVKAIGQDRISVLHSHGKGAGIYARLLSLLTGVPTVHTFHGLHVGQYSSVQKAIYLLVERILSYFTAAAICVSEGERALIEQSGFIAKNKLRTIPNGVGIPVVRLREPESPPIRIVSVSRFDHQKHPEFLFEIVQHLQDDFNDLSFIITVYGDGEKREYCNMRAKELGFENCLQFPGATATPREMFRNSHVYLSTSRWEGMPLALLEAMSEGLPVVATNVTGNRDLVAHGDTGFLYPEGDAETAASQLLTLNDVQVRQKLGDVARRRVEQHHSLSTMAERTVAVYEVRP